MKKHLLLMMGILLLSQNFAVAALDDDVMGLYFDTEANLYCIDTAGPFENMSMYLVLTNPTGSVVEGVGYGCDIVGSGMVTGFTVINYANLIMQPWDDFAATLNEPYPASAATVMVIFDVFYNDMTMGPLDFYLHGYSGSTLDPAYPEVLFESGLVQASLSAAVGPTSQVNGGCTVVATEQTSFSAIKSMYR